MLLTKQGNHLKALCSILDPSSCKNSSMHQSVLRQVKNRCNRAAC